MIYESTDLLQDIIKSCDQCGGVFRDWWGFIGELEYHGEYYDICRRCRQENKLDRLDK